MVRRIAVMGASGSGKSTVSRALADALGCPCLELDAVYHQPGWTPLDDARFQQRVAAVASGDTWVIDGNYRAVRPLVWARADTVIWLDLPRRTVMRRLVWRTLRRMATRAELWNGNRERWRNLFTADPERNIIVWAWRTHGDYPARFAAARADPANAHIRFIRLSGPAAVSRFLAGLRCGGSRRDQLGGLGDHVD